MVGDAIWGRKREAFMHLCSLQLVQVTIIIIIGSSYDSARNEGFQLVTPHTRRAITLDVGTYITRLKEILCWRLQHFCDEVVSFNEEGSCRTRAGLSQESRVVWSHMYVACVENSATRHVCPTVLQYLYCIPALLSLQLVQVLSSIFCIPLLMQGIKTPVVRFGYVTTVSVDVAPSRRRMCRGGKSAPALPCHTDVFTDLVCRAMKPN